MVYLSVRKAAQAAANRPKKLQKRRRIIRFLTYALAAAGATARPAAWRLRYVKQNQRPSAGGVATI
jgi:hypothetical protein